MEITVDFTHPLWKIVDEDVSGEVTGSFTGEDLDNNSLLSQDELSSFSLDSSVSIMFGSFSHDLSDLESFSYDINNNEILDIQSSDIVNLGGDVVRSYVASDVHGIVSTVSSIPGIGTSSSTSSEGPSSSPVTETYEPLFGTTESDIISVIGSNQIVFGGHSPDLLLATDTSSGNNIIYGERGDDSFTLGAGDFFYGGAGNDQFYVQTGGGNFLTGGEGADEFWIAAAGLPNVFTDGLNTITDFTSGEDVIAIAGLAGVNNFEDLSLETVGTDENHNTLISVLNPDGANPPLAFVQGIKLDNAEDFLIT